MKNSGYANVVAIVVVGAILLGALLVILPSMGGSAPPVPGTKEVVRADFDCELTSGGWTWDDTTMKIQNLTTEKARVFSMMPFGLGLGETRSGTILAQSIKNGQIKNEKQIGWSIDESWHDRQKTETFSFKDFIIGKARTGKYTLRVKLLDDDGDTLQTEERTISSS